MILSKRGNSYPNPTKKTNIRCSPEFMLMQVEQHKSNQLIWGETMNGKRKWGRCHKTAHAWEMWSLLSEERVKGAYGAIRRLNGAAVRMEAVLL